MFLYLKLLWSYKDFILGSVKREFQSKYQSSVLGAAWIFLNPLAMIVVYTLIFSGVMKAKLPNVDNVFGYSIYLCSGILTWGLFAEIVTKGQVIFLENANLLKKLNFPRLCLPTIVVANAVSNFLVVFGLFLLFLLLTQNFPGIVFFAAIPVLVVLILFAVGLGIVLGVLNVFFRDVGQFFSIFLTFWFWLTPIVYTRGILSQEHQFWFLLNPMMHIMNAFQNIFSMAQYPEWQNLIYPTVLAIFFVGLGIRLFRQYVSDMVDEL